MTVLGLGGRSMVYAQRHVHDGRVRRRDGSDQQPQQLVTIRAAGPVPIAPGHLTLERTLPVLPLDDIGSPLGRHVEREHALLGVDRHDQRGETGCDPFVMGRVTCAHQSASSTSDAPVTRLLSSSRPMIHRIGSPRAALACPAIWRAALAAEGHVPLHSTRKSSILAPFRTRSTRLRTRPSMCWLSMVAASYRWPGRRGPLVSSRRAVSAGM